MPNDWIFSKEFLDNSPSRHDGLSAEKETSFRYKTVWFIEDLAQKLEGAERIRNRKVVSTACVFFHRFYAFHSFAKFKRFQMSLACFFLACKVEECPLKLKDIVHAYYLLSQTSNPSESDVRELNKTVLICERILLQTLNFDLNILHPYSICIGKIKELRNNFVDTSTREMMMQTCFNFVNDSYRTPVCLLYTPTHIALSAFFLATIQLSLKPTSSSSNRFSNTSNSTQSWFELLKNDIDEDTLKDICMMIAAEYKDNDKKVRSDQILQKVSSIGSNSSLPTSSSFSSKQRTQSPNTPTAITMSEDSFLTESQLQHQDSFDAGDGSGRKRKMIVTVIKSATTLEHSEYVQQQQKSSSSLRAINSSSNSGGDTVNRPDSSVGSSCSDGDSTPDVGSGGDSTPCFPSLLPPMSLPAPPAQAYPSWSSSAAETPEFPSLPPTPYNASETSHTKKPRMN
eukprot:CAMPEP_0170096614 /NCGR_PEP_ID=MMETSP0019_2-20121128/28703_1 /TAXON_ID=98059 /ORGANISM="Dinobryon sp., Strain UTEXLB2267" /LENGTH=454 /DNA_ID=CAMNT_0010318663 /DNA_START=199 /DNA_END=1563 /DNA_ORIENTATION=+